MDTIRPLELQKHLDPIVLQIYSSKYWTVQKDNSTENVYYTTSKDNSRTFAIFFNWPETGILGECRFH